MTSTDCVVLKLRNTLDDLAAGQDSVLEFLGRRGISARTQFSVGLVFEEVVTNIIRHAYGDDFSVVADDAIEVTLSVAEEGVELNFADRGPPFNPLEVGDPGLPRTLGEAKVGGLGIMLVRKTARHLAYQRCDERNCLRVSIPLR